MVHDLVVEQEAREHLAHEHREHQHEDEQDEHGPEEGHEAHGNGVEQHPELPEETHGPDHAQGPHHADEAHHAHEGEILAVSARDHRQDVRVKEGEEHDEHVEPIEGYQEEVATLHIEPEGELKTKDDVEDVGNDCKNRVGNGLDEMASILERRFGLKLHKHDDRVQDDQTADEEIKGGVLDDLTEAAADGACWERLLWALDQHLHEPVATCRAPDVLVEPLAHPRSAHGIFILWLLRRSGLLL
mmetsp:Transcript_61554/g.190666  ORF Transcript_61554/g.190666 Transcript_61554/m.190666 type:complete len:244 (+) Transcript_61554:568-1299(+)